MPCFCPNTKIFALLEFFSLLCQIFAAGEFDMVPKSGEGRWRKQSSKAAGANTARQRSNHSAYQQRNRGLDDGGKGYSHQGSLYISSAPYPPYAQQQGANYQQYGGNAPQYGTSVYPPPPPQQLQHQGPQAAGGMMAHLTPYGTSQGGIGVPYAPDPAYPPYQHSAAYQNIYNQHNSLHHGDNLPTALPHSWFGYWNENALHSHSAPPFATAPDWFMPLPGDVPPAYTETLYPACPHQNGMVQRGQVQVGDQPAVVYKYYTMGQTNYAPMFGRYNSGGSGGASACIYPLPGVHFIRLKVNGQEHYFAPNGKSISTVQYNQQWDARRQKEPFQQQKQPPYQYGNTNSYNSNPANNYYNQAGYAGVNPYGQPTWPQQQHQQHPSYPYAPGGGSAYGALPPGMMQMPPPYAPPYQPYAAAIAPAQPTPSIPSNRYCDPYQTATQLYRAMKGWGCNEEELLRAVISCSNAGRQLVIREYQRIYHQDLIARLKRELTFNFEKLIVALFKTPSELDASELQKAMADPGTRERVLIEIMTTRNNEQIQQIKWAYNQRYRKDLVREIEGETSFYFKKLLVALSQGARDESWQTNQAQAAQDAALLYRAGEKRLGTDESKFIYILSTRNFLQLRLIFDEYQRQHRRTMEQAIKNEFSGDIRNALLAIVESIRNRAGYFAKQLFKSMEGMGTRDDDLIRIVVSRAEIDLADISSAYVRNHRKTLQKAIVDDTSGDYQKGLLVIVNGRYP